MTKNTNFLQFTFPESKNSGSYGDFDIRSQKEHFRIPDSFTRSDTPISTTNYLFLNFRKKIIIETKYDIFISSCQYGFWIWIKLICSERKKKTKHALMDYIYIIWQ